MQLKDVGSLIGKIGGQVPGGLQLLGSVLTATGIGAPEGAIISTIGAGLAHVFGTINTPEALHAAISADPQAAEKLAEFEGNQKVQLQQLSTTLATAAITAQVTDVQGARAHDIEVRKLNAGKNNQATVMLAITILGIVAIAGILVWRQDIVGAVSGFLIAAGMSLLKDFGKAFDYSFGAGRAYRDSDETDAITAQAQAALKSAAPPQARQ